MAIKELTSTEIETLVGSRHSKTGLAYPANGLQPYYEWIVRSLHLLAQASAADLKVDGDDTGDTYIRIAPGRAAISGQVLSYGGSTIDLATYNNDTAYVWLRDSGGAADVAVGADASGWPDVPHIKLAQVTLAAGVITTILDRRFESLFTDAHALGGYTLAITTQGSTSTASVITIATIDAQGEPIAAVGYLRVRICDSAGYATATNATIAAGSNTTVVQTHTTNKDMTFKSHTDGSFVINVTDTTAETVTMRIGGGDVTARRANYLATLDITHA